MCWAGVEGERCEQEAREGKKKAMDGANKKGGVREQDIWEWRRDGEKNGRVRKN